MAKTLLFLLSLNSIILFSQDLSVPESDYVFTENKGQILNQHGRENNSVIYLYKSPGLNIQLKNNGFSYDVYEPEPETKKSDVPSSDPSNVKVKVKKVKFRNHRIDITFAGANKNPQILASGQSETYESFYNLPHKPQGISNVRKFQKVIYKDLYPNIDLVFFRPTDKQKVLEYNFIVRPGGKVSDIKLKFIGAKSRLKDGQIVVDMIFGQLQESVPASWLEDGNNKDFVKIGFEEITKGVFGFKSEKNSYDKTLVIDPVPTRLWGSYIGGGGEDYGNLTVDADNYLYLHGTTKSTDNIATEGSHQNSLAGSFDGFIMKVDKDGRRIWSTYYGKQYYDAIVALDFDDQKNIYAAAAIERNATYYSELTDIGILKFTPEGSLLFEKILGGPSTDQITDIKFHKGWIYTIGHTNNNELNPETPVYGPLSGRPFTAGFLGRFNSADGVTDWLKLIEGNAALVLNKFIDSSPNLELIGVSRATDLPLIKSFQQPKISGYSNNGIYINFSPDGEFLQLAYFGENGSFNFDSVQRFGDEIVVGGRDYNTNSAVFFTANTSTLQLSSWKVPSFNSMQTATYIDRDKNMFVTGLFCHSDTAPETTPNAYMPVRGMYCASAFLKYNFQHEKIWGTYYTGNRATQLGGITKDNDGFLYFYGLSSGNTTGISTPGVFQEKGMHPSNDGYIAKFADAESFAGAKFTALCAGSDLRLEAYGGENFEWFGPNGFHSFEQNPVIRNAQQIHSGEYFVRMMGGTSLNGIFTVNVLVGDASAPTLTLPELPDITGNCNTVVTPPTATDNCGNVITGTTTQQISNLAPGIYTILWTYLTGGGTVLTQQQKITILAVPLPAGNSEQSFCKINRPKISDIIISGTDLKWFEESGAALNLNLPLTDGTKYYVTQTLNGCESGKKEIAVKINDAGPPSGATIQEFCPEQKATVASLIAQGQTLKWYDSLGNLLPLTTVLEDGQIYYAAQTLENCESSQRLPVLVKINQNAVDAADISETFCSETVSNTKTIDLKDFESRIISASSSYIFTYAEGNIHNLKLGLNSFNVKVSTPEGCFKQVKINLTLNPKPQSYLPETAEYCAGQSVILDAGADFSSYLWSTGATTRTISVNAEGLYTVKVTNGGKCENSSAVSVKKSLLPQITNVEIKNRNAKVVLSGGGDFYFSLDNLNWQKSEVFNELKNGKYIVFVRTSSGCTIGQRNFTIFSIPNSFTPNGDGVNDTWKVEGLENHPDSKVSIYDRYGQLVHNKIINGGFEWNGEFNSRTLPTGNYWFVIKVSDGRLLQGYVLLKNRN